MTIPKLYPTFEITFSLYANTQINGDTNYGSILRLTNTNQDSGNYGDHQPALMSWKSLRRFRYKFNWGHPKEWHQDVFEGADIFLPSTWTPVRIKQGIDGDIMKLSFEVDGTKTWTDEDPVDLLPVLENVNVYAGDDFNDPLDGKIRNLTIVTGKKDLCNVGALLLRVCCNRILFKGTKWSKFKHYLRFTLRLRD